MYPAFTPILEPTSTSHSGPQTLTGTTPFPNESDEKIADKIAMGVRPGWPPNNPWEWTVSELWGQIEACWNQEPNGRPTALEVLQTLVTLGAARRREFAISAEDFGDEAMIGDWENAGDGSENGPEESTSLVGCHVSWFALNSTLHERLILDHRTGESAGAD